MTTSLRVTHWESATPPTQELLMEIMERQQLEPYTWSNRPNDSYSAHKHDFEKVIYVVEGNITFNLPILKRQILLNRGDRLDLPAHVVHSAQVGPEGVVCIEGHKLS